MINFFEYPQVKPYGLIKKKIMAEMDKHRLALAYGAVVIVSSGEL